MENFEITVETITPDDARIYLQEFTESALQNPASDRIEAAIRSGNWIPNGDAIIFDEDGSLLDGRNRLAGCVMSDIPIETVVARGVPKGHAITIGTHRKRRTSDYFKMLEVDNHSMISKVVNVLPSFANGTYTARRAPHHTQSLAIYETLQDELQRCASFVGSRRWMDQSYNVATWLFLLGRVDMDEAVRFVIDAFEDTGISKEHLEQDDPARILYNRLYRERNDYNMRLKKRDKIALVILAWNMRREGRTVRHLRWNEANNERFPAISGWSSANDLVFEVDGKTLDMGGVSHDAQDLDVEVVLITPEMAAEFMERNLSNNRRQVESTIRNYARDMASGNWRLNGQAIKFDADGTLIDGQHRLLACISSGKPFMSLVVYNVPRSAFVTYDDRPGRKFSDVLTDSGIKYATHVASLTDRMLRWDDGRYERNETPTVSEQHAYFVENAHLANLVKSEVGIYIREPARHGGAKLCRPSAGNLAYALLYRVDPERAGEFMTKVVMGGPEPAIQSLRNFLMNLRDQLQKKEGGSVEIEHQEVFALLKAWNAWIEGKEINNRAFARNAGEPFPEPKVASEPYMAPEGPDLDEDEEATLPSAGFLRG